MTVALMEKLPKLKIISCFGVGVDGIDVPAARKLGIAVTNTPDVLTECVADNAMALVLATMRRTGVHVARVFDETGATRGVLFLEDIIEELVGEVQDATRRA